MSDRFSCSFFFAATLILGCDLTDASSHHRSHTQIDTQVGTPRLKNRSSKVAQPLFTVETHSKPQTMQISFPADFSGKPVAEQRRTDGLMIEDFVIGSGEEAVPRSMASVHYTGYLFDGTVFDTSHKRGKPIDFPLGAGRVIRGWDEGIAGMRVGGKRRLTIPAELGYGKRQVGPIPANSQLVFTVELMNIKAPPPPPKGEEAFAGKTISEKVTSSGLKITDYALGSGPEAKPGDKLSVHYTGKIENGSTFDSSIPRGQPFRFPLGAGRVIKGWDEGLAGMKVGGLRKLVIPPDLGYGTRAMPGIPANSQLTFTIELIEIQ